MKYQKPDAIALGTATVVIQDKKAGDVNIDGDTTYVTVNAYQADE
jgi:hypothetical protein